MSTTAELIFPPSIIPELERARGPLWQKLLVCSRQWHEASLEQIALTLMLARLNNCTTCTTNSYRALQGCVICSKQTLKRFRGTDEDLLQLYSATQIEVNRLLQKPSSHLKAEYSHQRFKRTT